MTHQIRPKKIYQITWKIKIQENINHMKIQKNISNHMKIQKNIPNNMKIPKHISNHMKIPNISNHMKIPKNISNHMKFQKHIKSYEIPKTYQIKWKSITFSAKKTVPGGQCHEDGRPGHRGAGTKGTEAWNLCIYTGWGPTVS